MTLTTTNYPAGITVAKPVSGVYGINPGLLTTDAFTGISLVVTSDNLSTADVNVYIDSVANGTMHYSAGTWSYVPGTPVVFTVGRHNLVCTFIDTVGGSTVLTLSFFTISATQNKSYKKLSTTLGQIKKGYAYDSVYGKMPITQVVLAPALGTATAIHANITLPTTGTTAVTTGITNPDVPRVLSIKGNAAGIAAKVTIVGLDINGFLQSETITASGSSAVVGKKAFSVVNSITVGARTTAGDAISVGTTAALGLARPIDADTDFKIVTVDGVAEAAAAINSANDTVTVTTAFNGAKNTILYYNAAVI